MHSILKCKIARTLLLSLLLINTSCMQATCFKRMRTFIGYTALTFASYAVFTGVIGTDLGVCACPNTAESCGPAARATTFTSLWGFVFGAWRTGQIIVKECAELAQSRNEQIRGEDEEGEEI
jgi:hypothetical protein